MRNIQVVDIVVEQYGNVSLHVGVVDIVHSFVQQKINVAYGTTIEVAYKSRYVHAHQEGYLISIGN
jgi:hypothetical protein